MIRAVNSLSRTQMFVGAAAISIVTLLALRAFWKSDISISLREKFFSTLEHPNPNKEIYQENLRLGKRSLIPSSYTVSFLQSDTIMGNKTNGVEIEVTTQHMTSAAQTLVEQGHRVAIVNCADPTKPGGDASQGPLGDEELLSYISPDWCAFMDNLSKKPGTLYPLKFKDPNRPRSPDQTRIYVTSNVTICRDSTLAPLPNPFEVGIISSTPPSMPLDKNEMNQCTYAQFAAAYNEDYDCLVIGAFGCDKVQNAAQLVASSYHKVLSNFMSRVFKKVVFAIPDPTLAEPFRKLFAKE